MASDNIESSIAVCDILKSEMATLTAESLALDARISDLRLKKAAVDQAVADSKLKLLQGSRELKKQNVQKLQAEYELEDVNEEISNRWKRYDDIAVKQAKMETEIELTKREIEWKTQDLTKVQLQEKEVQATLDSILDPLRSKRDSLFTKLDQVSRDLTAVKQRLGLPQVSSDAAVALHNEGGSQTPSLIDNFLQEQAESLARKREAKLAALRRDITLATQQNDEYRHRMNNVLEDLKAKVIITKQKLDKLQTRTPGNFGTPSRLGSRSVEPSRFNFKRLSN